MSHVGSHIIIKGNYTEAELAPGQVGVTFVYNPSLELTEEQVLRKVGKLRKLAQKAYHIESEPDDE